MPVGVEKLYYRMQRSDSVKKHFSLKVSAVVCMMCWHLGAQSCMVPSEAVMLVYSYNRIVHQHRTKYESDFDIGNVPMKLNIQ